MKNGAENSYLFVPSGSGTLVYADRESDDLTVMSESVYGNDIFTPEDGVIKTVKETVRLPVFGAKNGDSGMLAVVTEGAGSTEIAVNYGNRNMGYSSVYAVMNVREAETMVTNNGSKVCNVYPSAPSKQRVSVSYYPLHGREASYVGMAKRYRSYLEEKYSLKSGASQSLISLEILGGTTVTRSFLGVPYDAVYPTTTISQTEEIINGVSDASGEKPAVRLTGFGESGLDIGRPAGNFKINKRLGTAKQLKVLAESCRKNGVELFFDYNVLQFKKGARAARTTNGRKASLYYYDLRTGTKDTSERGWNNKRYFFMLGRSLIPEITVKAADNALENGLGGISLETLTSIGYSDYSSREYYSKGNVSSQVSKTLGDVKKKGLKIAAVSANDYAAVLSDYIFDTPSCSTRRDIFGTDVPFYQIVLRGYKALTSKPLESTADNVSEELYAVETGISFNFAVTYSYGGEIVTAEDARYYGSNYEAVKQKAAEISEKYGNYYKSIDGALITEHEIISEKLHKTVFSNGVEVYVNYDDAPAETPIGIAQAVSYIYSVGGAQK